MNLKNPTFANLALYASFLVLGACAPLLGATLQYLVARYDIPLENGGIFTSLQFAGATAAVVVFGRLYDRLNTRWLLTVGPVLLALGLLLLALIEVRELALLATFLYGVGYGALVVGPNVLIVVFNPQNPTRALNLLNVFFGIGAIIGPQVVNLALRLNQITLAYLMIAAAVLLLLPALWQISYRAPARDQHTPAPTPLSVLALLPFGALLFVYVGSEIGYSSWFSTQITQVAGAAASLATVGISLFWAGLTLGRMLASAAAVRLSAVQIILLALLSMAGGTALLLSVPESETIALISAFIVGMGCGPVFPTALALFGARYPAALGASSGALIAIANIGGVVLPPLQGRVGGGENGGMTLVLAATLLMLALLFTIYRQTRQIPYAYSKRMVIE
ncbi:MAG: MFS transporter [bacterium]|nr:MFS transporter [bacterium]